MHHTYGPHEADEERIFAGQQQAFSGRDEVRQAAGVVSQTAMAPVSEQWALRTGLPSVPSFQ
jgi:hypothetical protein